MAQVTAKAKAAASDDNFEKAAAALRAQGSTSAVICHTLGVSYRQAVALANAYDKKVGHPPKEIKRLAEQIKPVPGYPVVKDGRSPKTVKAVAAKAKPAAKRSAKPTAKPVGRPEATS